MDLSKFKQDETCQVVIKDPVTGQDTDIKITVYGQDTKVYRSTSLAIAKGEVTENTPEYMLASLTKSWENLEANGEEIELTLDNAVKVYLDYPFIYSQLERVIFDRVKFMKAMQKS